MKAITLAILLAPALALGQTFTMSYQGRLLDTNQTPVLGSKSLTFTIYYAAQNGTDKWHEAQTVQLTNGFYAVKLGVNTPFDASVFDGNARWLGVKVDAGAELTPRQFIATVPYAFRAQNAVSAGTATNVSGGGTVSAASVTATGAVSAAALSTTGNATVAGTLTAGNVSTSGTVTAAGGLSTTGTATIGTSSVTGNETINGSLTVKGEGLRIPGGVVGGVQLASSGCGSSGCNWTCTSWGDGHCASATLYGQAAIATDCSSKVHAAGYTRGTLIGIGGGYSLCIQGVTP